MDPELIKKALDLLESGDSAAALELLKQLIASAAGAAPAAAEAEMSTAEVPEAPPAPEEPAARALLTALAALTGKESPGEQVEWLRALSVKVDSIDNDRAALELTSRRELIAELVTLGVEFPSTAWEGKPEDRKPVKRLADEPLAELRSRVALLRKARPAPPRAPEAHTQDISTLTAAELAGCKRLGLTPQEFVARKANAVRRAG